MFKSFVSGSVPFLRADKELISDFTGITSYIEAKVSTVCLVCFV